ncbi:MAG: signal peptide peptidase SppA [Dysgonamonadaceae bacterium]|jgi:protease-4|nr:signal peptide peptidase SppA [Dysgonamonadaceae bacterium]
MKNFFKMVFASIIGVFIAFALIFILSLVIIGGMAASMSSSKSTALLDNSILRIDLDGEIPDRITESNPFSFFSNSEETSDLDGILSAIEKAKTNDKIKGIYLRSGSLATGYATMETIRKALLDFKTSGKFIYAYGDDFSQRTYYACSAADSIFLNPEGIFDLRGLASVIQFNKSVLKNWGIETQIFKVGTFKSAVEPYMLDKMSDANRQQVTSYLGDLWGNLTKAVSESRGIPVEQINAYADELLAFSSPQTIVDYRLIDGLKYYDEMEAFLKGKAGLKASDKLRFTHPSDMETVAGSDKKISKNKIAVLYAEGDITVEDSGMGMFGYGGITSDEYVREIAKLKADSAVKAVVFRVNSPGGSAYASEQIWRAIEELKKDKPVVVSMGTYAASGGYYISCGANKIVAEPGTLTGSIGVFGIIPNAADLAKRMGATYDGVSTNKHSDFEGAVLEIPLVGLGTLPARPLDSEVSAKVQVAVERTYETFKTRCAEGRGKTVAEIDSIGQGRVWTGNQALEIGLVDRIGGIDAAVEEAASLAGLTDYSLKKYPAKKEFFVSLMEKSTEDIENVFLKLFLGEQALKTRQFAKAWGKYDFRQAVMQEVIF